MYQVWLLPDKYVREPWQELKKKKKVNNKEKYIHVCMIGARF